MRASNDDEIMRITNSPSTFKRMRNCENLLLIIDIFKQASKLNFALTLNFTERIKDNIILVFIDNSFNDKYANRSGEIIQNIYCWGSHISLRPN